MTQLKDPFDYIFEFEEALAAYTGAPYAVTVDRCTHAIELAMRYDKVKYCRFTAHTYLSVVQTMHILGIEYTLVNEEWQGEYQFHNTRIWDSARLLAPRMYRPGMIQCLSFGHTKPLQIGTGGAVLTDDRQLYETLSKQRSDGRDLRIKPWQAQVEFDVGYHYNMTPEQCEKGLDMLPHKLICLTSGKYPDCRDIKIKD